MKSDECPEERLMKADGISGRSAGSRVDSIYSSKRKVITSYFVLQWRITVLCCYVIFFPKESNKEDLQIRFIHLVHDTNIQ